MKKNNKILGSIILIFAMLISVGSTNGNSILAKTVPDRDTSIRISEIGNEDLTGLKVNDEIHEVEYDGDYKYELDMVVLDSLSNNAMRTATSLSNDNTHYAIGTFKCYYKNTTWVYTGHLQATFHYNGTYAWATYGYYSWENNTSINFSQIVTKNTYSSKKVTGKTKYVVTTSVNTCYGNIGTHTMKITCTPNGVVDSSISVS